MHLAVDNDFNDILNVMMKHLCAWQPGSIKFQHLYY